MPKDELPTVNAFLSSYIQPPEKSPFFVAQDRLRNIDPALIHPFQQNLAQLIASQINPSIQALLGYLNGDYASKAPQGVGLSQYPSGKEYYRFLVHNYTTLEVSPDEVHRIGLAAVEKDEAKMAEMRRTIGFQGTSEDFNRFVKTNERFFPKTPEEIEARLMSYVSRVRNVVGSYFAELPKAPYGVKRLDPALEAGETFGHYDQPSASEPMGIYYFNGSNLQERSLFNAAPLILHELVPGHHFQINLQTENRALPEFRRQTFPAAYTEGWGDYSAKLGQDMGVYQEPYDFYACLAMDMFISVRLVVDTGMNDKGWSRSKAVEFMRQHELEADAQIQSESLRYSVDIPGQALAYKMGSLELSKLRDATKTKLGDHFDIKRFHACVLNSGAMPLTILKDHVEWCMQNPPVAN